MARFGIPATARASLAMYNTRADIDALAAGLEKIVASDRGSARDAAAALSTPSRGGAKLEVTYPKPAGASPQAVADDLADVFEMLGDRDARNEYVLDLGQKLPHTFELLKKVTPRVTGCMSEVYLIGRRSPDYPEVFEFIADANADIVRGLIALLQRLYSGQRAADVLAFDIEAFFRRIGLDQFITSQRRNGLAGMIQRIRDTASRIASAG
jgi:cysteine desulfurase/selenocysteine lyase